MERLRDDHLQQNKAAISMVARAKAAKKLMRPKSAAVAGPDPNALMIEDAAAEEEERGSNSNRGSVDAEIAAAVDRRAREQLHAAFQRTREEMDAAALAKKKRKLEEKKEETAAVSDREEKKDEAAGSSGSRQEKKDEAANSSGSRQEKEEDAAGSSGSREEKKEDAAAPEGVAMEAETAKDTESESDYGVRSAEPYTPSGEPEGCSLLDVDSDDTDWQPVTSSYY